MTKLLTHLAELVLAELKANRWSDAVLRLGAGIRALWFPRQHQELLTLDVFKHHVAASDDSDALFYLSHRHYLSTRLSNRQRIECALTHYRYEALRYDDPYKEAVYRNGGLELWAAAVDGVHYSLRLRSTESPRNEGGNSVVLHAADVCLSEMSFVWLDGSVIGSGPGILPFITRNQSIHHDVAALSRFRECFPQNSPSYFCLAAMHGIASAHGRPHIAGISHDCQIAFEHRYTQGFLSSYTEFWKAFGGAELDGHAYLMPVPLASPPLSEVKAKHRKRARERRRHWADITTSAADTTSRHLRVMPTRATTLNSHVATLVATHMPTLLSFSLVL